MKRARPYRLVACCLAALALAGCQKRPMTVRAGPAPDTRLLSASDKRLPPRPPCRLVVDPLVDSRLDPTTLGRVGVRTVRAPTDDVAGWLRGMLHGLGQRSIDLQLGPGTAGKSPPHGVVARAELISAWVSSLSTTLVANVVMRFDYQRNGTAVASATYRGNDTVVNWSSGDSEIQGALDRSFGEVLDQVQVDVHRLCFTAPTRSPPAPPAPSPADRPHRESAGPPPGNPRRP